MEYFETDISKYASGQPTEEEREKLKEEGYIFFCNQDWKNELWYKKRRNNMPLLPYKYDPESPISAYDLCDYCDCVYPVEKLHQVCVGGPRGLRYKRICDCCLKLRKMDHGQRLRIKDVIFNGPATIVFWADGEKTVVKCSENDVYDPEKGLAMAIAKRALGNKSKYYDIFKKWVPEDHSFEDGDLTETELEDIKEVIAKSMRKMFII